MCAAASTPVFLIDEEEEEEHEEEGIHVGVVSPPRPPRPQVGDTVGRDAEADL